MRFMKRLVGAVALLAVAAIASATLAPVSLATKATPSVSLKAKPTTVKVGKTVTFTGTVKHAVANDGTVRLWLVGAKKSTMKAKARISSTGAFKFTAKAAKAGPCVLRVTYGAGKTTFRSNKVTVTITN
jgi:plastocyanin